MNQKVALVRACHDRTFDASLTTESYAANDSNLDQGVRDLAVRCRAIIRAIGRVREIDDTK
jgi:hypothetical protein